MPMDLTDGKSTMVQVMAWCRQATSHYLNQCWPKSLSPLCLSRPQWVNWHNLPMIWIWISNYMYCFVWDVIIHPCPNFDRTAVGDRAWTSNYIPLFKLWRVDSPPPPPTHTHTHKHTQICKKHFLVTHQSVLSLLFLKFFCVCEFQGVPVLLSMISVKFWLSRRNTVPANLAGNFLVEWQIKVAWTGPLGPDDTI